MAAKKQEAQSGALPARFDSDKTYAVNIKEQFKVGRMVFHTGVAHLQGDVAEQFRDKLEGLVE